MYVTCLTQTCVCFFANANLCLGFGSNLIKFPISLVTDLSPIQFFHSKEKVKAGRQVRRKQFINTVYFSAVSSSLGGLAAPHIKEL